MFPCFCNRNVDFPLLLQIHRVDHNVDQRYDLLFHQFRQRVQCGIQNRNVELVSKKKHFINLKRSFNVMISCLRAPSVGEMPTHNRNVDSPKAQKHYDLLIGCAVRG